MASLRLTFNIVRCFERNLKDIKPKSEEVEKLYSQAQRIVIVSIFSEL